MERQSRPNKIDKAMKYLMTIPNARFDGETDLRATLSIHCFSLAECRRIWKGAKGKRIYKLVK